MSRAKGARRALAMHVELARSSAGAEILDLAGVMRDVIEERQMRLREHVGEHLAQEMREDLAVGERAIDRRTHGPEIVFPDFGMDGGAGELAVGNIDAVLRCR